MDLGLELSVGYIRGKNAATIFDLEVAPNVFSINALKLKFDATSNPLEIIKVP